MGRPSSCRSTGRSSGGGAAAQGGGVEAEGGCVEKSEEHKHDADLARELLVNRCTTARRPILGRSLHIGVKVLGAKPRDYPNIIFLYIDSLFL